MSHKDELNTGVHYRKLFETYGGNYQALNWGGEQSQILRFSVLAEVGDNVIIGAHSAVLGGAIGSPKRDCCRNGCARGLILPFSLALPHEVKRSCYRVAYEHKHGSVTASNE